MDIPKTRLGVFATEDPTLGTAVVAGYDTTIAVIGKTFGEVATIPDEAVERGTSPDLDDTLLHNTITRISKVADIQGGVAAYVRDVDYRLSGADTIEWLGTVVAPLTSLVGSAQTVTPTPPNTGLTPGDYEYVVTSIREIETSPSVIGETVVSNLVAVTVGGGMPATNATRLTWTPSAGSQGYRVYRKLAADPNFNDKLIAEVPGGASNYFVDDGYSTATGTPPVANNAYNRPADGATYYVTYVATLFNHFTPTTFFSLTELVKKHSLGSDLTIAGSLVLGGPGVGQGASKVMTISIPDYTVANFLTALAVLENEKVDIIVPLTGDPDVQLDVAEHVVAMSDVVTGKRRMAFFGNEKGTQIGDPDTVGSMVWAARRLELSDDDSVPQGKRIVYVAESSVFYNVQLQNGVLLETELDGWFLAVTVAGKVASLKDPATPVTFKQLRAINSLGQNFTANERDYLDSEGLLTCFDDNGVIKVYHGRTIDLLTVEHGEISIVRTEYELERRLTARFASFVGAKITEAFLMSVETSTDAELGIALKDEIISDYSQSSIEATQQTGLGADPRRIDVVFQATPIYPANQIVFKFGFNI